MTAVSRGCCGALNCSSSSSSSCSGKERGSNGLSLRVSVFDQSVDVMLGAMLTGRHFEYVSHTQQSFQSVPVRNDLR